MLRLLPRRARHATIRAVSAKDASIAYQKEKAVESDSCAIVDKGTVGPYRLRRPLKIPLSHRGMEVIQDPLYNKGTAFEPAERDRLGLRGLLPPKVSSMDEQCARIMLRLRSFEDDIQKHMYLSELHDRNETLFHRVVVRHIGELAPLIYTPTVGQACLEFGHMFKRPRGMYFSADDIGQMNAMVDAASRRLRPNRPKSHQKPASAFSDGDESRRWRNLARRPPHDTKPPQRAGAELADEGRPSRRRDGRK